MVTERRLTLDDVLPRDPSIVLKGPRSLRAVLQAQLAISNASGSRLWVMDYGCGDAARRGQVDAKSCRYVGIDPFSNSADVVAAGERLPFRGASFDVVVSIAVFEHLLDPARGVAEIARTMKPGGVLIGYSAFLENFHEVSYHHLSHKGVEHLFEQAGLRLVSLWPAKYGLDYQLGNLLVPGGRPRFARAAVRGLTRFGVGAIVRAQAAVHTLARRIRGRARPNEGALRLRFLQLKYASGISFEAVREG